VASDICVLCSACESASSRSYCLLLVHVLSPRSPLTFHCTLSRHEQCACHLSSMVWYCTGTSHRHEVTKAAGSARQQAMPPRTVWISCSPSRCRLSHTHHRPHAPSTTHTIDHTHHRPHTYHLCLVTVSPRPQWHGVVDCRGTRTMAVPHSRLPLYSHRLLRWLTGSSLEALFAIFHAGCVRPIAFSMAACASIGIILATVVACHRGWRRGWTHAGGARAWETARSRPPCKRLLDQIRDGARVPRDRRIVTVDIPRHHPSVPTGDHELRPVDHVRGRCAAVVVRAARHEAEDQFLLRYSKHLVDRRQHGG
jgi:hypothetical protein